MSRDILVKTAIELENITIASREEIWEMADEILASGNYPTNAAVRDRQR